MGGRECSSLVLEQREKERKNRILGSARGQFHKVHADAIYDLEVDTHHSTLSEIVEKIKSSATRPSNCKEAPNQEMKIALSKATQRRQRYDPKSRPLLCL